MNNFFLSEKEESCVPTKPIMCISLSRNKTPLCAISIYKKNTKIIECLEFFDSYFYPILSQQIMLFSPKTVIIAEKQEQLLDFLNSKFKDMLEIVQVTRRNFDQKLPEGFSYVDMNKNRVFLEDLENKYYLIGSLSALCTFLDLDIKSLQVKFLQLNDRMFMSQRTMLDLEILNSENGGKSLYSNIRNTKTGMGNRLLKENIMQPFTDINQIKERHKLLQVFKNNSEIVLGIEKKLHNFIDIDIFVENLNSDIKSETIRDKYNIIIMCLKCKSIILSLEELKDALLMFKKKSASSNLLIDSISNEKIENYKFEKKSFINKSSLKIDGKNLTEIKNTELSSLINSKSKKKSILKAESTLNEEIVGEKNTHKLKNKNFDFNTGQKSVDEPNKQHKITDEHIRNFKIDVENASNDTINCKNIKISDFNKINSVRLLETNEKEQEKTENSLRIVTKNEPKRKVYPLESADESNINNDKENNLIDFLISYLKDSKINELKSILDQCIVKDAEYTKNGELLLGQVINIIKADTDQYLDVSRKINDENMEDLKDLYTNFKENCNLEFILGYENDFGYIFKAKSKDFYGNKDNDSKKYQSNTKRNFNYIKSNFIDTGNNLKKCLEKSCNSILKSKTNDQNLNILLDDDHKNLKKRKFGSTNSRSINKENKQASSLIYPNNTDTITNPRHELKYRNNHTFNSSNIKYQFKTSYKTYNPDSYENNFSNDKSTPRKETNSTDYKKDGYQNMYLSQEKNSSIPIIENNKYSECYKEFDRYLYRTLESDSFDMCLKKNTGDSYNSSKNKKFSNEITILTKRRGYVIFKTSDLQKINSRLRDSYEQILQLEWTYCLEILNKIKKYANYLQKISQSVAELDVIHSFYLFSNKDVSCLPEFGDNIVINNTYHLSVDKRSRVHNNIYASHLLNYNIVTGANMGGKTTYIKQVGQCAILAQIGCPINANYAKIKIFKNIMTRLSHSDIIENNLSTFGVELGDIKTILQFASEDSLVLIDELGRGTNYIEGLAIAISTCKELLNKKSYVYFITHFLEVVNHIKEHPRVNVIKSLKFRMSSGVSEDQQGIDVCKEYFPTKVIEMAYEIKNKLSIKLNGKVEFENKPVQLALKILECKGTVEKEDLKKYIIKK